MGLTLTRRLYERIIIGDQIVVEIVEIRRDQVKLNIVAPGLVIDREEVRQRRNETEVSPGWRP